MSQRRLTLFTSLVALTALLALAGCRAADNPPPASQPQRVLQGDAATVTPLMDALAARLPAADAATIIAYVRGDDVTIAVVGNPAIGDRTQFEYGSITKVLTANILVQLADEGRLSLDDSLNRFLPADLQDPKWEPVTLRALVTHSAGIPGLPPNLNPMWLALTGRGDDPYADFDQAKLLEGVRRAPVAGTGEKWEYSNFGFALLGYVAEQVTGQSYTQLAQERIFAPAGMTHAGMNVFTGSYIAPPLDGRGQPVTPWDINAFAPAGALRGDIHDGIAFLRASMAACANSDASSQANCQAQEANGFTVAEGRVMGLGWVNHYEPEGRVVWHNGGTGGFSTFLGFNPATQTGLVLLTNVADFTNQDALARDLLLGRSLAAAAR